MLKPFYKTLLPIFVVALFLGAIVLPAKAATVSETQAQIAALETQARIATLEMQARIDALMAQIARLRGEGTATSSTPSIPTTPGTRCVNLTSYLQLGTTDVATGGQVTRLQAFLAEYYSLNTRDVVSGYFGPMTQGQVQRFQRDNGLTPEGTVGPLTRAKIAERCGSTSTSGATSTHSGIVFRGPSGIKNSYAIGETVVATAQLENIPPGYQLCSYLIRKNDGARFAFQGSGSGACQALRTGSSNQSIHGTITTSGGSRITPGQYDFETTLRGPSTSGGGDGPSYGKTSTSFRITPATGVATTTSTASSTAPSIYRVEPSPLVPGSKATIFGRNLNYISVRFGETEVGGVSSGTRAEFTVPALLRSGRMTMRVTNERTGESTTKEVTVRGVGTATSSTPVVKTKNCAPNFVPNLSKVWGTDTYTSDSDICTAALHAEVVTRAGGAVTYEIKPGQTSYTGTSRNGVRSQSWGQWKNSYVFTSPKVPALPAPTGSISATACVLGAAPSSFHATNTGVCDSSISWSTNNAVNAFVVISGTGAYKTKNFPYGFVTRAGIGLSGSNALFWTSAGTYRLTLYADGKRPSISTPATGMKLAETTITVLPRAGAPVVPLPSEGEGGGGDGGGASGESAGSESGAGGESTGGDSGAGSEGGGSGEGGSAMNTKTNLSQMASVLEALRGLLKSFR